MSIPYFHFHSIDSFHVQDGYNLCHPIRFPTWFRESSREIEPQAWKGESYVRVVKRGLVLDGGASVRREKRERFSLLSSSSAFDVHSTLLTIWKAHIEYQGLTKSFLLYNSLSLSPSPTLFV